MNEYMNDMRQFIKFIKTTMLRSLSDSGHSRSPSQTKQSGAQTPLATPRPHKLNQRGDSTRQQETREQEIPIKLYVKFLPLPECTDRQLFTDHVTNWETKTISFIARLPARPAPDTARHAMQAACSMVASRSMALNQWHLTTSPLRC